MKEEENTHCGYYHDNEGICINDVCRTLPGGDCSHEWEECKNCKGKGYHAKRK